MIFIIARIVAILLLLFALGSQPYEYYTVLKLVVCGVTAFGAYLSYKMRKESWSWILGIIAFLFNPIFKINLGRGLWGFVDIITAIIILVSIITLKEHKEIKR